MLLFEAKEFIDERAALIRKDFKDEVPDYLEALEKASKCMEAQLRLMDLLSDWNNDFNENDRFSAKLVDDMLNECRYDYEGEEE